jgi:hypothetical protein
MGLNQCGRYQFVITQEKIELSINEFLNVNSELLPLLVIIDFPYGKLVKTTKYLPYKWVLYFSCAQENKINGKY